MGVLSGLEPKAVFAFFEDLCALPHGSRHTRPVSDYMVAFAQQRGLRYRRDEVNNVIIWKDAAPGYEDAPAVMLQGHMDMLVEKEHNCTRNTEEVGLDIFVAGDEIGARGTTLGADDGIGWPWPWPCWTTISSGTGPWSAYSPWTRRWACRACGPWTCPISRPGT